MIKRAWGLFRRAADGTGEPQRLGTFDIPWFATAITPDGNTVVGHVLVSSKTLTQGVYTLPTNGKAKPQLLIPGKEGNATNAHLSPDGKWIVYQLQKQTRSEIIVHPFPNITGGGWQVTDWGSHPVFGGKDDELFYRDRDRRLVSVKLRTTPQFMVESPVVVLENTFLPGPGRPYDISPDGQKFILINETRVDQTSARAPQLNFILNWNQELKRLVPPK